MSIPSIACAQWTCAYQDVGQYSKPPAPLCPRKKTFEGKYRFAAKNPHALFRMKLRDIQHTNQIEFDLNVNMPKWPDFFSFDW